MPYVSQRNKKSREQTRNKRAWWKSAFHGPDFNCSFIIKNFDLTLRRFSDFEDSTQITYENQANGTDDTNSFISAWHDFAQNIYVLLQITNNA